MLKDVIIWGADENPENYHILDSAGDKILEPYDEYFLEVLDGLWEICTEFKMEYIISTILYMSSNEELQKLLASMSTNDSMPYKKYLGSEDNPYLFSDNSDDDYQFN